MNEEAIRLQVVIGATPERIYEAWLSSGEHGAFTGGEAAIEPRVGGAHTEWDGYIKGVNLALEPSRRIIQSWRSLDFPESAPDSRLEVSLERVNDGTQLTLVHSQIPDGQRGDYEQGWLDYYFTPMKRYFEDGVRAEVMPASMPVEEPADEPVVSVKVQSVTKAAPKKKAKAKVKAKAKAKTKFKFKSKTKAETKTKTKTKSKSKSKTTLKTAAKTKAKAKPKKKASKPTKKAAKRRR